MEKYISISMYWNFESEISEPDRIVSIGVLGRKHWKISSALCWAFVETRHSLHIQVFNQRWKCILKVESLIPKIVKIVYRKAPMGFFETILKNCFQNRTPVTSYSNNCEHCRIGFEDAALYTIHKGYHGFENPLKCNRCGETFSTALDFNLHLWREKHE